MGKRILTLIVLAFGISFAFSSQAAANEFTNVNLLAACVEDGSGGYIIEYGIVADTDTGPEDIFYSLSISGANFAGTFLSNSGPFTGSYTVQDCGEYSINGPVIIKLTGQLALLGPKVVSCSCNVGGGGTEGCSPGYWKNHLENWEASGYTTYDDFDTVFDTDLFEPDITLGMAIRLRGGGVKKLARHGTAALLSAAHPEVDYSLSLMEVINTLQAGNSDALAIANELGCPLN